MVNGTKLACVGLGPSQRGDVLQSVLPCTGCSSWVRSCLTLGLCIAPLPARRELGRGFRKSPDRQLLSKASKGNRIELTPSDFARNTQGDFVYLMSDYTAITF